VFSDMNEAKTPPSTRKLRASTEPTPKVSVITAGIAPSSQVLEESFIDNPRSIDSNFLGTRQPKPILHLTSLWLPGEDNVVWCGGLISYFQSNPHSFFRVGNRVLERANDPIVTWRNIVDRCRPGFILK